MKHALGQGKTKRIEEIKEEDEDNLEPSNYSSMIKLGQPDAHEVETKRRTSEGTLLDNSMRDVRFPESTFEFDPDTPKEFKECKTQDTHREQHRNHSPVEQQLPSNSKTPTDKPQGDFRNPSNSISQNASIIINNNISHDFRGHMIPQLKRRFSKDDSMGWTYILSRKGFPKSSKSRKRAAHNVNNTMGSPKRFAEENDHLVFYNGSRRPTDFTNNETKRYSIASSEDCRNPVGAEDGERINDTPKRQFGHQKVKEQTALFIERQLRESHELMISNSVEAKQSIKCKTSSTRDDFSRKLDRATAFLLQNSRSSAFKKRVSDATLNFRSVVFPMTSNGKVRKTKASP